MAWLRLHDKESKVLRKELIESKKLEEPFVLDIKFPLVFEFTIDWAILFFLPSNSLNADDYHIHFGYE